MNTSLIDHLKLKYSEEYDLLQSPDTWCKGAIQLANSNDHLSLILLLKAYLLPVEKSKYCLLDAMEMLGGGKNAIQIWKVDDNEVKKLALHLMRLFPSEAFLNLLYAELQENKINDKALVVRTLINQRRNEVWEEIMLYSLQHVDIPELDKIITELEKSISLDVIQELKKWRVKRSEI